MLKSFFLAGFFLVSANILPTYTFGVPNAHAAVKAHTPRTAVKHSSQMLGPEAHGAVVKLVTPLDPSATQSNANDLSTEEREFIRLINGERTSRGLNSLTVDRMLVSVARSHSQEMCSLNYFDHHSPTAGQVTPMDRYLKGLHETGLETPPYLLVGENIYYCSTYDDTYNVGYGHQALMNSPGHRANILEPRFARIGVGIYRDSQGEFWVTEMFLKDRE